MKVLAIVRPLSAVIGGSMTGAARMGEPDPKEAAFSDGAGERTIDLDLGAAQDVGAIYLGGVSGTTAFAVSGGLAAHGEFALGNIVVAPKRTETAPRQYLLSIEPAQSLRYIRLTANLGSGFEVGVAFAGERFSPTWGREWGSGRYLIDTGAAARNKAGGFGINPGAIVPGFDFTLGDLTDEETEELFDMLRKVGETNPILIVEDPELTADLDARVHYGLLQRIEKYERQSLGVTRWSLKVEEWR